MPLSDEELGLESIEEKPVHKKKPKSAVKAFRKILGRMAHDISKKESRKTYKKVGKQALNRFLILANYVNQGMSQNLGNPYETFERRSAEGSRTRRRRVRTT